ncbi:hypothetical protein SK3146_05803 [Paenibacillus konkukensis]|uniref:Uncharacterized protein n=1 Tax=Paenibacillus konkukensis TaxID=2020716 RepID=A0ABY4RXJ6_9BACL|nr:hypothetical protein SK3146_05803 [Paenibacillus konkukensis]
MDAAADFFTTLLEAWRKGGRRLQVAGNEKEAGK